MGLKNSKYLLLLLVMLFAQLAIAQHNTIHFSENIVLAQHEHDEQTPKTTDHCQICIFAKGVSHALTPSDQALVFVAVKTAYERPFSQTLSTKPITRGFHARAPPTLLS